MIGGLVGGGGASLMALPSGLVQIQDWIALDYRDPDGAGGIANAGYEIHFKNGTIVKGQLDGQGKAMHENVQRLEVAKVVYLPRKAEDEKKADSIDTLLG
jgi:uncharacterized protein (DUF2345 family)